MPIPTDAEVTAEAIQSFKDAKETMSDAVSAAIDDAIKGIEQDAFTGAGMRAGLTEASMVFMAYTSGRDVLKADHRCTNGDRSRRGHHCRGNGQRHARGIVRSRPVPASDRHCRRTTSRAGPTNVLRIRAAAKRPKTSSDRDGGFAITQLLGACHGHPSD